MNYRNRRQNFNIHLSFGGKGFYSSYFDSDVFLKEADRLCLHVIDCIIDYSIDAYHEVEDTESLLGISNREKRRKFFESFLPLESERKSYEMGKNYSDPKDFCPRLLRDFCEEGFNSNIRVRGVGEAISWFARSAVNWEDFSLCFSNSSMGFDYSQSLENYLSEKTKNIEYRKQ